MKTDAKTYQAAVYLRLSREDGDVTEGGKQVSNSIANQKELIMDYLKSHHEIRVVSTYTDDGYSGVDFERPDFRRLLSDIRENKINCVVVKDLSRFGRNYIESGRYIEKIFPMLGVRFIAVTDGYDSISEDLGSEMIIPFKNLINDAYCRDISVKIRSHMDIKRRNGEYIGAFAAYGYLKDKENKNHLVVDEYAADVVRDIFSMKLCGMSQQAIADRLNADGILSPLQYKKSIGIGLESSFQKNVKSGWSYNAVLRILKNEVYTGTVVQGKCTTPNYKIKKRVHKAEDEWIRVRNTHDAIIPRDEFDLVQELLLRDTRVAPDSTEVFPLGGMLFCADCGETMVRKTVSAGGRRYVYYVCSGNKKDKRRCSVHSFSEKKLTESVLEAVKAHIRAVLSVSEAAEIISGAPEMKPDVVKCEERMEKLRAEADECNVRRKNLYEDYKDGILTKDEYFMMRDQYQKQLEGIECSMEAVRSERDAVLSGGSGKREWIEKLRKYKDADSLDRGLVTFLIDRIEVAEGNRLVLKYRFEKEIQEMERIVELYSGKEAV